MVLTDSGWISRVPPYLGYPLALNPVSSTGLSPSIAGLSMPFDYRIQLHVVAPQPRHNFLRRFSLFPFRSPLLGESLLFSSPPGTEMFHFTGFAPPHLCIQRGVHRHYPVWVSPFGHSRIIAWLAAPRDFSQPPTSFFASDCLGIHRVPFAAWSLPPLRALAFARSRRFEGPSLHSVDILFLLSKILAEPLNLSAPGFSLARLGGADRDRTDDIQLAKLALSQLSYSPCRSLSLALPSPSWWAWKDLNFRPHAYQACALTN